MLMTTIAYLAIILCGHRHAINTNWGFRLITTEHVYTRCIRGCYKQLQ